MNAPSVARGSLLQEHWKNIDVEINNELNCIF